MIRSIFLPALRHFRSLASIIVIGLIGGCGGKTTPSIELEGEWLFVIDPSDVGKAEKWFQSDHPRTAWRSMEVREFEGRHGLGSQSDAVWFAKKFQSSGLDSARMLLFSRVYGGMEVWLNGVPVGSVRSHGDVYTCSTAGLVRNESNELVVRLGAGGELYGPISVVERKDLQDVFGSSLKKQSARPSADWVRDAVVYEISVRSFSDDGTFGAVERKVDELKELGASVLLLMPIHPIGDVNRRGSLGNPYAVQDFHTVNPEFGTMEEFRSLVETVHRHGMKILIDFPASQAAWDSNLMFEHPEWFLKDESGAIVSPHPLLTDVAGLNYDHHELRKVMIAAMEFWVREVDIDGYQFDGAEVIPLGFWEIVRSRLENIKPVMLISNNPGPQDHLNAFDVTMGWGLYDSMVSVLDNAASAAQLRDALRNEELRFPLGALHLRIATQPRGTFWETSGSRPSGRKNARSLAGAASFLLPGIPVIHNGDETGSLHRLEVYEKNPVNWKANPEFRELYEKLIGMRKNKEVLRRGVLLYLQNSDEEIVTSFERRYNGDRAIILFNWGQTPKTVTVQSEQSDRAWKEYFGEDILQGNGPLEIRLDPYSFKVFLSEDQPQ